VVNAMSIMYVRCVPGQRHTTLTWVERNFGFAIAHAYAGHTEVAPQWPR
jgi:hypothetical protein